MLGTVVSTFIDITAFNFNTILNKLHPTFLIESEDNKSLRGYMSHTW